MAQNIPYSRSAQVLALREAGAKLLRQAKETRKTVRGSFEGLPLVAKRNHTLDDVVGEHEPFVLSVDRFIDEMKVNLKSDWRSVSFYHY